jgi:hypothetical protein
MLEENKTPQTERETLAVRSRIYIYSKTGKVQRNRDKDLLTKPPKKPSVWDGTRGNNQQHIHKNLRPQSGRPQLFVEPVHRRKGAL